MSIKHIRSAPALWKAFLNETNIHRELKHINIVCLHACFLDQKFSYFVLELCRKEVLFHLIYILSNHNTFFMFLFKCRHWMTWSKVEELWPSLKQDILCISFCLGSSTFTRTTSSSRYQVQQPLLLNDNMDIKIADFGLATKLQSARHRTRLTLKTFNLLFYNVLNIFLISLGHTVEPSMLWLPRFTRMTVTVWKLISGQWAVSCMFTLNCLLLLFHMEATLILFQVQTFGWEIPLWWWHWKGSRK